MSNKPAQLLVIEPANELKFVGKQTTEGEWEITDDFPQGRCDLTTTRQGAGHGDNTHCQYVFLGKSIGQFYQQHNFDRLVSPQNINLLNLEYVQRNEYYDDDCTVEHCMTDKT